MSVQNFNIKQHDNKTFIIITNTEVDRNNIKTVREICICFEDSKKNVKDYVNALCKIPNIRGLIKDVLSGKNVKDKYLVFPQLEKQKCKKKRKKKKKHNKRKELGCVRKLHKELGIYAENKLDSIDKFCTPYKRKEMDRIGCEKSCTIL